MINLKQRRQFLLRTSSFALSGVLGAACVAQGDVSPKPLANPLIRSIVETILPRDNFAGALDLGYDQKLAARIKVDKNTASITNIALEGINSQALKHYGDTFNTLGVDQREQILNNVLEGQHQAQLRRALQQIRNLVFNWYYASEVGQDSINYLAPSRYPAYSKAVSS